MPAPRATPAGRGYRAIADPAAVGRTFEVLLDLTLESQDARTVEHFEYTTSRFDEVRELRRLFGSPDFFVRVAVSDLAAYEAFLSRHFMTILRIGRVKSGCPWVSRVGMPRSRSRFSTVVGSTFRGSPMRASDQPEL